MKHLNTNDLVNLKYGQRVEAQREHGGVWNPGTIVRLLIDNEDDGVVPFVCITINFDEPCYPRRMYVGPQILGWVRA